MGKAIGHRRVKDDLEPVGGIGHAVNHFKALRRMHPAVQHDDPEGGHTGAESHKEGGQRVQPSRHAAEPEQHDAQKHSLKKEGRHDLVGQQWPRDVADGLHETGPVGAELKGHGDARHDAHGEAEGKDLDPEPIGFHPFHVPGGVEPQFKEQEHPTQRDRDRREQDVEGYVGPELNAGQNERVHDDLRWVASNVSVALVHRSPLRRFIGGATACAGVTHARIVTWDCRRGRQALRHTCALSGGDPAAQKPIPAAGPADVIFPGSCSQMGGEAAKLPSPTLALSKGP
mmetsp:Transcript_18400/g.29804  ORF Transcript_18400/g.29804 Transcript_18400/m.29804 type:complete len:286 (+) Transcript_18400:1396-2253(+)